MKYVVVGGGIAGVNCALEVLRNNNDAGIEVTLISASSHVKTVTNWYKIGQFTEHFEVKETDEPLTKDKRLTVVYDCFESWDSDRMILKTRNNGEIRYNKLCIATGATPKCEWKNENVLCIRDTDTAIKLQEKLKNAKHLIIVGNGGIATELVYELKNIEISWLIRDSSVSSSFFPPQVESFILPKLLEGRNQGLKNQTILKRRQFTTSSQSATSSTDSNGAALGPDWCTSINLSGNSNDTPHSVKIVSNCEVSNISNDNNGLVVDYSDIVTKQTSTIHSDFVIWATGVTPNSSVWSTDKNLKLSDNGGISVNDLFETSIPNVYACGDVCSVELDIDSQLWKQMNLWTQARQMGELCGKSMVLGEESRIFNIYLELFTHCTSFFGLKVVFLGDYKPEKQPNGTWRVVERIIGDGEYVRCVVVDHKVIGALLIGETNLEETMENMILNGTNIEDIEETFLDPDIEIDDYFD